MHGRPFHFWALAGLPCYYAIMLRSQECGASFNDYCCMRMGHGQMFWGGGKRHGQLQTKHSFECGTALCAV